MVLPVCNDVEGRAGERFLALVEDPPNERPGMRPVAVLERLGVRAALEEGVALPQTAQAAGKRAGQQRDRQPT
jgi:hypothetical protein